MSFKNIVTSENLLGDTASERKRSEQRTNWRKRARKSANPEERKAAEGNLGQLSKRTKQGG